MGSLNGRNSQFTHRSPTLPTTPIQESALEHDETSLWYDSPKEKTRHRAKSQQVSAFSNTALKGNSTKAHLYHPLVAPLPQKAPLPCCQSGKRPDSSSLADGLRASAIKSTLVRGGHTLKKQHARLCTRVRSLEGSPQFRSPKLLEICPRAQQSASTRKRLGGKLSAVYHVHQRIEASRLMLSRVRRQSHFSPFSIPAHHSYASITIRNAKQ